jgi:hypothetical protein
MKRFFLFLSVSLFALAACEKTSNNKEPQPEPQPEVQGTLSVTETSVDMAFYGGEGVVNYTITNGKEGAKPTVTVNQEWVTTSPLLRLSPSM